VFTLLYFVIDINLKLENLNSLIAVVNFQTLVFNVAKIILVLFHTEVIS